jgi:hypothetical protein
MILRHAQGSLLLIPQHDHAALARRIMESWSDLGRAERRATILRAIGEHDRGWIEPDAAPIIDPITRRIQDFVSAPLSVRQGAWAHAIAHLGEDPWAAALVAQHALFVYERYHSSREWKTFFSAMASARATALRRVAPLTLADLERDYLFVRLGDLASLTFCCGWITEQKFAGYTMRLQGTRLLVSPDAFAPSGREIHIEIAARVLPDSPFASDAEAAEAYRSAATTLLSGTIAGAPGRAEHGERRPHA